METPEKIYLTSDEKNSYVFTQKRSDGKGIEYIRKDVFIEKVCEFIRKGGNRGDAYIVTEFGEEVFDFVQFAEDFKNNI